LSRPPPTRPPQKNEPLMRTFVAIELSDDCRRRLGRAVEVLRRRASGVKWVSAEAAHITLKFIGELPEDRVPDAIAALKAAARSAAPFSFRLEGISGFPPSGRPRIIHSPAHEPTGAMAALAVAVEKSLCDAVGVAPEERGFKAHVTIGRVKNPRECPRVEELAALVTDADFGEVTVRDIVLMKSELTPRGPIYTPIERVPLGE